MKKICWESENGYRIELVSEHKHGRERQYILGSLDGNMGQGEAQTIKPPDYDGAVTYGLTRGQRDITLAGTIVSYGNHNKWVHQSITENRDYLARCFDPKYFGTLCYYAYIGDSGRKIRCRPTAFPVCDDDFGHITPFKIGFVSDMSHWVSARPLSVAMGMYMKNFRFPHYTFPTSAGFIFNRIGLDNPTLYNIKPHVTIYASAKIINFRNNTTGAFLKFRTPLTQGERIVIDTFNVKAYIEDYDESTDKWVFRENVLRLLTIDSDITNFLIVPGVNNFELIEQLPEVEPIVIVTGYVPVMGV